MGADVEVRQRRATSATATSVAQERLAGQEGRLVRDRVAPEQIDRKRSVELLDRRIADRYLAVDDGVDDEDRLVGKALQRLA